MYNPRTNALSVTWGTREVSKTLRCLTFSGYEEESLESQRPDVNYSCVTLHVPVPQFLLEKTDPFSSEGSL